MQMRDIGKSGIKASAIGLGTWAIGGGPWWGKTEDKESVQAIQAALDSGINFIDTAPAYGFGRSEEVIGKAIRGRRDKTVLATNADYGGMIIRGLNISSWKEKLSGVF